MSQNTVREVSPEEAKRQLDAGRILLVDVREPHEYQAERIHGALLFPLKTFDPSAIPSDEERELVFHCGTGKRSLDAAQRCLAAGRPAAAHVTGGLKAWREAGLPTVSIDPSTGQVVDQR